MNLPPLSKWLPIVTEYWHYSLYFLVALALFAAYSVKEPEMDTVDVAIPTSTLKQQSHFSMISTWHLFGLSPDTALVQVQDAHIRLVGIIYRAHNPRAIIMINDKEVVLSKGEKIDSRYQIQKIEPHRIVVSTKEGFKSFELFEKKSNNRQ